MAPGAIFIKFSLQARILKIILARYWLKSWRALTLKWHFHCFLVWHFYENSKFFTNCNFSNFLIFIFQIFYSGKEKKKKRDMAQGFNDLLIQPMDDLYRWSSPLTQSFNFKFTNFSKNLSSFFSRKFRPILSHSMKSLSRTKIFATENFGLKMHLWWFQGRF